jgi:hypothetical protein
MDELARSGSEEAKLFDLEIVIGELFTMLSERGHQALAITLERRGRSPSIHIYSQGASLERAAENPYRAQLLRTTRVPMSLESSDQGAHICLRLLLAHEEPLRRLRVHPRTTKFSLSF